MLGGVANFTIPWHTIVYVGNPSVMFPAAAAIAAWLLAGRWWKMAACWCLLFGAGLSVVVSSKIYFMGWGEKLRVVDFQALSGHALLTTAILPVAIYLLLQRSAPPRRAIGAMAGMLFAAVISICLVIFHFHSLSEAVGGFAIGACVSLSFIRISRALPTLFSNRWQLPCAIFVFLAGLCANPKSMEYWMTDAALHLSGHSAPYSFTGRDDVPQ